MKTQILILLCIIVISAPEALGSLVVGHVDDFEDNSTQGWSSEAGHEIINDGGPGGVDDAYLQIIRPTPSAPYPFHLGTKNTTTWMGNYLSAGIQAIAMDVKTISITSGPTHLSLRIVLFGPGGAFSSKEPVTVITDGDWQHIEFGLTRSDLVRILGAGAGYQGTLPGVDDLTATLRNVSTLLIRHDSTPTPTPVGQHPEHIMATLGIDNIEAILGPAPIYDVAWTFGNIVNESYVLDRAEPGDVPLGHIGTANPTLLLHTGKRYQVTVLDAINHPFELIAKGEEPEQDEVLLSAAPGTITSFESDPDVAWFDNGAGTVAFTLADELYEAATIQNKRLGYRSGDHPSNLRGNFDICTSQITSDLNGDCKVDFQDLALFAAGWLDSAVSP